MTNQIPDKNLTVAKLLEKRIHELSGVKNQREIAAEAGFLNPNFLSMLKKGDSRVPLDRVPALAKALSVDPAYLYRMVVKEKSQVDHAVIEKIFGTIPSENELQIIQFVRNFTGDANPKFTDQAKEAFIKAYKQLDNPRISI